MAPSQSPTKTVPPRQIPVVHADEEEVLDWDACVETPPPRPCGLVEVEAEYAGRSKPLPLDCPENGSSR